LYNILRLIHQQRELIQIEELLEEKKQVFAYLLKRVCIILLLLMMDEEEGGGGDVAVIVSDLNATLHSEERDCLEVADYFNSESAGNGSSFFRKDGLGELWNTVKNFCVFSWVEEEVRNHHQRTRF
jgi:hypothetical protein